MKRQLPVLSVLVAAIDLSREHISYALKVITPWFLVLVVGPCLLVS